MRLDQLINQTLEELKQLGIAESTIKSYRYSAYSLIRNYCVKHGTNCYKPATLDSFLSAQKKRIENSEISKRHYRKLRRAVQMLHEIYQYGTLQWDYYSARSIYKSNDYFSLCLKEFLDAQHLSRGTIANLRTYILQFLCYIEHNGHCDFNALLPVVVKDYLMATAETHQGSMGNVLYALRLFFNYLKKNSLLLIDLSPILNKPAQRKKKILPCFTHEEVETILKQIDIDTKEGKRDYAILFLASHTGLRAVDIANLRLTDLDWVNDTICIVQRKTGRLLILPMETDTGNAIAAYILEGRPESDSEHVFLRTMAPYRKLSDVGAVGNILQKYLKKAGLTRSPGDGKSFHGLRRSMGTWMLESGVPLTTISQVLGHKEQDSAKQYLSMDHKRLAECTLDFQGIPIKGGLFL